MHMLLNGDTEVLFWHQKPEVNLRLYLTSLVLVSSPPPPRPAWLSAPVIGGRSDNSRRREPKNGEVN